MKTRTAFTFGLSALLLGGAIVGSTHQGGIAFASTRSETRDEQQAAKLSEKATKAIAKRHYEDAVGYAETAVQLQPSEPRYRTLLAMSYLQAGRFASARQAYADVLTLDPANGRAALNLALAQIAEGNWAGGRATLEGHADIIPASDRGLAMALAGDPKSAVQILMPAARTPGADAKTRQNLALALALAGDWRDARVIVSMDLSPADVDVRLGQWAQFAQPRAASDQVASLLGVTPSADPGFPVALALNAASTPAAVAAVDPAPIVAVESPAPVTEDASVVAEAPVTVAATEPQTARVVFGPRQEIVQAIPMRMAEVRVPMRAAVQSAAKASPAAAPTPRQLASGKYFVQLGAYENAAVAKDGWARATRRLAGFAQRTPSGMSFSANGANYYRLSVGGFSKNDARYLCGQYRAKGGRCFIRVDGGDQVAQWVKKGQELASR